MFIEQNLHLSGFMQFKPVVFEAQLTVFSLSWPHFPHLSQEDLG